ncbi:MAG: peroxiredoxin [Acidobacteriota bacterium]
MNRETASRTLVLFLMTALLACGQGVACAAELPVGAKAPAVDAVDQDGHAIKLGDAYGSGFTLVYFYPKADTPGCTKQACSIRDGYAKLTDAGVHVFGVSHDTPADQKAFKEKYKLPFTLLADTDSKVTSAFGVPSTGSFANREAFLIKDGKIVWRDTTASTDKQADDVLEAIGGLGVAPARSP